MSNFSGKHFRIFAKKHFCKKKICLKPKKKKLNVSQKFCQKNKKYRLVVDKLDPSHWIGNPLGNKITSIITFLQQLLSFCTCYLIRYHKQFYSHNSPFGHGNHCTITNNTAISVTLACRLFKITSYHYNRGRNAT